MNFGINNKSKILELEEKIKELNESLSRCLAENEQLHLVADYDDLTGVYNRHGFIHEAEKFLHEVFKKTERRKFIIPAISFVFVDLDGLKSINDKYGHNLGDKFIVACAKIFKEHLREIDVVGRWGGDEFIIGLVGANNQDAYSVSEKLRKEVNNIKIDGIDGHKFSASFGVFAVDASIDLQKTSLAKLIERSDKAMYVAKKKLGKDAVYAPDKLVI